MGADEIVFDASGIDISCGSLHRFPYKEYHTSDDNLKIISNKKLNGSVILVKNFVKEIQKNQIFTKNLFCEPFLSKYNLINNISKFEKIKDRDIKNICAYVTKNIDVKELGIKFKISNIKLKKIINKLLSKKIIKEFI